MTDRRDEEREITRREREAREGDERRREHVERRFDDLKESWRRNHPREEEDSGRDQPRRGRGSRHEPLTGQGKRRHPDPAPETTLTSPET